MLLAYRRWKKRDDSPPEGLIVLLHGMGGTGSLWRPIAATLEDRFDLLAPDQRGHGQSLQKQSSYAPADFGQDVIETLDSLNFHPAWIIGHSMGVRTACAAAYLKPEWVRGLILVDLGFSGPAGGGLGENLAQFLRKLPMDFASRAEARNFMDLNCPDPSMAQYLMAVSVMQTDGSLHFPFDKEALIETLGSVRDTSVRPWLRDLGERGMPVLAVRGENSQVWSKADFEKEKKSFSDLPSVRFAEVPGTGHGLPFEKRKEFLDLVLDFIHDQNQSHPRRPD